MDDLFAPPGERWQRLAPAYRKVRLIGTAVFWIVPTVAAAIAVALLEGWPWALATAAGGLGWTAWRLVRIVRWVDSWGYAEREEDLYLTHGLWFKSLTAVPYGRMQLVKVESGPIERAFGLATVSLVTASAHTNARIPGLPADEAARLRDRLIEVGQAQGSGL